MAKRGKSTGKVTGAKNDKPPTKFLAQDPYRLLMQAPACIAVLTGPDLVFEMANPLYRQLVGEQRPLDGQRLVDAIPDIEPDLLRIVKKVATKGERFVANELAVHLDWGYNGKPYTKYLNLVYEPLRDAKNKPNGLMCFGYDVTDQVLARKKAEEDQERYQTLFNSVDQGFCVIEMIFDKHENPIDYRFLEINPAFEKHTGLLGAQGKTARQLILNLEPHWFERYGKVAVSGKSMRFEENSKAMDRWFDVYAVRVGGSSSRKVALLFTDVTESKRDQEQLRYRTALLEAQNETIPDGILIVDAKGKIVSYNRRFKVMWHMPLKITKSQDDKAALQFAMQQLIDPQAFIDRVNYLYAHANEVSHEEIYFKDGRIFDRYGMPVKDAEGRRYGWAWHFRDMTEQKKAQKALRESEQHFRATFDQAAVGIAHVALDGSWMRVNQKFCDILGYSAKEMLSEKFQSSTHPDDLKASLEAAEAIQSGKKASYSLEKRYIRKDGTVVWANVTVAPSLGRRGHIKHFITVIEDINERKQTEASLHRQSKVLENMAEGVSVTDQDGRIVFSNPAEDAMFGYERGELIGQHVTVQNAYPPKANKRIVGEVIECLKKNSSWVGEWENIRKDGSEFQTSARISAIELDGKQYWVCVQENITERKKAEQALRESDNRFRQLADSMPQIVWTARPDGYLDYYNKRWYDYTGFKKGRSDQSWTPILHPNDVQPCFEAWYKSIKTGAPYHIEYRLKDRRNPGQYRWFLGKALPVKDEGGKIIKWFGTTTETQEVKEALKRKLELEIIANNLAKQRTRLLALNKAKDEFISLASHQLRTPASGVKQYIGMLLEGYTGDLSEEQRDMLQVAYESNERQLKIVDGLLKVAHVDAGKVQLSKSTLNLTKIIQEVLDEQSSTFKKREQEVVFKPPSKPISAVADSRHLRMVLENLVDNASKYSGQGKKITLRTRQNKTTVTISIKDQGVGIDQKDRKKLFQKFSRIDNPLSATVDSTGLGLYWAKRIMDLHGGTISVVSKPDEGSTFTIHLPII